MQDSTANNLFVRICPIVILSINGKRVLYGRITLTIKRRFHTRLW